MRTGCRYGNHENCRCAQKTKTVQAFSALTERLREGEAVQEALSGSFEILTGAGN